MSVVARIIFLFIIGFALAFSPLAGFSQTSAEKTEGGPQPEKADKEKLKIENANKEKTKTEKPNKDEPKKTWQRAQQEKRKTSEQEKNKSSEEVKKKSGETKNGKL